MCALCDGHNELLPDVNLCKYDQRERKRQPKKEIHTVAKEESTGRKETEEREREREYSERA